MRRLLLALLLLSTPLWSQETRRPTVQANDTSTAGKEASCSGINQSSGDMPNFFDESGEATSSNDSIVTTSVRWEQRKFSSWSAASGPYSSLTLKVRSACDDQTVAVGSTHCSMQYSTNGGTSWTTIFAVNDTDRAATTDTVSLSASLDLSQLQVRYCIASAGDGIDSETIVFTGFDIRTEGVLAPPVISNVQATGIGHFTAMITWSTDQAADSQVEYGLTTSYGSTTTPDRRSSPATRSV